MLVWPGLRLIGIPKGAFVAVTEVEPKHVRLDNGLRLKHLDLTLSRLHLLLCIHELIEEMNGSRALRQRPG